jgi:hypothetical protein
MIKKYIPPLIKKKLKMFIAKSKWKGSYRIFCISMQRCGTTSVGDFFEYFGYQVSRSSDSKKNHWSRLWYNGDFESIFKSEEFKSFQIFEDYPWWFPEFYKILYNKFPNSKFILFTRDSESWFQSMLSHSKGQTLGNTKIHCKLYRREKEFYQKFEGDSDINISLDKYDNLLNLKEHEKHYKDLFETRNKEIINYFEEHDPSRLIHCDLNDSKKWQKLGDFFDIPVPNEFNVHSNKSYKKLAHKNLNN